jgi:hypothetical protein
MPRPDTSHIPAAKSRCRRGTAYRPRAPKASASRAPSMVWSSCSQLAPRTVSTMPSAGPPLAQAARRHRVSAMRGAPCCQGRTLATGRFPPRRSAPAAQLVAHRHGCLPPRMKPTSSSGLAAIMKAGGFGPATGRRCRRTLPKRPWRCCCRGQACDDPGGQHAPSASTGDRRMARAKPVSAEGRRCPSTVKASESACVPRWLPCAPCPARSGAGRSWHGGWWGQIDGKGAVVAVEHHGRQAGPAAASPWRAMWRWRCCPAGPAMCWTRPAWSCPAP